MDATKLTAQVVPYSSVVGSSVMVMDNDGPCVAIVSIRGMQSPVPQATQETLAELIAAAINQRQGAAEITRLRAEKAAAERERDEARDRALVEAADAAHSRLHPKNHRSDWTDYAEDSAQHAAYARDVILSLRNRTTPPPAPDDVRERVAAAVWDEIGSDFLWREAVADPGHSDGAEWARGVAQVALSALSSPSLCVWYGSMPESSGRQNWTASVHQNGRDPHLDGFCFARSEYPDRVRYEADRMKWVLGTGPKPHILDYDEKTHSGYVEPSPAPSVAEAAIPTRERLPEKPGLRSYEHVRCLIFVKGEWQIGEWNCEHLVWDDEHGDDFRYHPTEPTHWMPVPPSPARALASEGGA